MSQLVSDLEKDLADTESRLAKLRDKKIEAVSRGEYWTRAKSTTWCAKEAQWLERRALLKQMIKQQKP